MIDIINNLSIGILILNMDYQVLYVNKSIINYWGEKENYNEYLSDICKDKRCWTYANQEIVDKEKYDCEQCNTKLKINYLLDKDAFITGGREVLRNNNLEKITYKISAKTTTIGERRYIYLEVKNIQKERDLKIDIKKKTKENVLFKTILNNIDEAIFCKNIDLKYTFVNEAFCKLVEKTKHEILGKNSLEVFGNELGSIFEKQSIEATTDSVSSIEVFKDGKYYKNNKIKFLYKGTSAKIYGILRDITEVKKNQEKIYYDSLSGLFNRNFYEEVLNEHDAEFSDDFAVTLIDIDNFKNINDNYGHHEGDKVIKIVSKIIKQSIRDIDFPIRIGGDEFLIVTNSGLESIKKISKRIENEIEKHNNCIVPNEFKISLSFGISNKVSHSENLAFVVKKADFALYESKKLGKGKITLY